MEAIGKLYVIFLGIILPLTTGFGIAAFYPEPRQPNFPTQNTLVTIPQSCYATPEAQQSQECQKLLGEQKISQEEYQVKLEQYNRDNERYRNESAGYTRTAVFFGVAIGAIFIAAGLALLKRSTLVASGILLGGVLTAVLTRWLIILASLGAPVTGTQEVNVLSVIEFLILAVLSAMVIFFGLSTFKEKSQ